MLLYWVVESSIITQVLGFLSFYTYLCFFTGQYCVEEIKKLAFPLMLGKLSYVKVYWFYLIVKIKRCKEGRKMEKVNVSVFRGIVIFVALFCVTMIESMPLLASPVAYWKFDDGVGSVAYDSVGSNNGTLINHPTWTTEGKIGGALSFEGFNEYVSISTVTTETNFSFSVWFKLHNLDHAENVLFGKSDSSFGYPILLYHDYVFCIDSGSDQRWWEYTFDTEWHHLCVVQNNRSTQTVLIDGISYGNEEISNGISDFDRIGTREDGYGKDWGFRGLIDDVAVWERALDSYEVDSVYDVGVEVFENIHDGVLDTFSLGYSTQEINQLTQLYAEGKDSLDPDNITIDGTQWQYYDGPLPGDMGYDIGTSYLYEGNYYMKLGSGLAGTAGGSAVPEVPVGNIGVRP